MKRSNKPSPSDIVGLTRREFITTTAALCAMGAIRPFTIYASSDPLPGIRNLSLADLQKRFHNPKEHLSAYENFTAGRGEGSAKLIGGPASISAGQRVPEWKLNYRAAAEGIRPGGYLRIWLPNGASLPVLGRGDVPSSVLVSAEGAQPVVTIEAVAFYRQYGIKASSALRVVRVAFPDGLAPGGVVALIWKDVKVGDLAPRWAENRLIFHVYADHDADGFDEEIASSPSVEVHPGPADRLLMRCASTAVVGEKTRITVAALDKFDNPASGYTGTVEFGLDEGAADGVHLPNPLPLAGLEHACAETSVVFTKAGIYWLKTFAGPFTAYSNPVEVFSEAPAERLYWGDMHFHTDHSADARAGSNSTTDYAGAYQLGRRRYGLDFMAATDHHSLEQGNYDSEDWKTMQQITNEANDPGHFATFVAMELSGPKGDQNIYFSGNSAPFLDHTGSTDERQKDWAALEGFDCFAPPHHFCQDMRPWDWSVFNAPLQPVCEVFSNHGRAEYPGNKPDYCGHGVATLPGHTWTGQLAKNKRLGVLASSDDHTGRPGCCGLTGVWSPALTREDLHRSIKNRRCYATTDTRTILHFSVDGHPMGASLETNAAPVLRLRAAAPTLIREIAIVKNGSTVHLVKPKTRFSEWDWTDPEFREDAYYYIRLSLDPNPDCTNRAMFGGREEFVWSSPVWVRHV